jgi:Mor family transcriptional regulator
MKVVYEYSHLGGSEILQVRYKSCDAEIYEVIKGIQARKTKISKEKTKKGKALYSPINMNAQFKKSFNSRGYSELRDTYTLAIPNLGPFESRQNHLLAAANW